MFIERNCDAAQLLRCNFSIHSIPRANTNNNTIIHNRVLCSAFAFSFILRNVFVVVVAFVVCSLIFEPIPELINDEVKNYLFIFLRCYSWPASISLDVCICILYGNREEKKKHSQFSYEMHFYCTLLCSILSQFSLLFHFVLALCPFPPIIRDIDANE